MASSALSSDSNLPLIDIPVLFKQLFTLPSYSNGWLLPSSFASPPSSSSSFPSVLIQTSQRDVENDLNRDYQSWFEYSSSSGSYQRVGFPMQLQDVIGSFPSPSARFLLTIRKQPPKPGASASPSVPSYLFDVSDRVSGRVVSSTNTSSTVHGRLLLTGTLGGIEWNADETAVVFVAEPAPVQTKGWFGGEEGKAAGGAKKLEEGGNNGGGGGGGGSANGKGQQFEWKEEWGEVLGGVVSPRVYIFTLATASTPAAIHVVEGIPETFTVGQAVFTPDSTSASSSSSAASSSASASDRLGLIVTGWGHDPRKLGLTHYNSRSSRLYYLSFSLSDLKEREKQDKIHSLAMAQATAEENEAKKKELRESEKKRKKEEKTRKGWVELTPQDHSAMCARFTPDGKKLIYVTTDKVWLHFSTSRLRSIEWTEEVRNAVQKAALEAMRPSSSSSPSSSPSSSSSLSSLLLSHTRTVVDVVSRPSSLSSFPGLYTSAGLLPSSVFFSPTHLILTSQWRERERGVVINVENGKVTPLPFPEEAKQEESKEKKKKKTLEGGSMHLLEVSEGGKVLVSISTPVTPPSLWYGRIQVKAKENGKKTDKAKDGRDEDVEEEDVQVEWHQVVSSAEILHPEIQRRLELLEWEVINTQPTDSSYTDLPFGSILVRPPPYPAPSSSSSSSPSSSSSSSSSSSLVVPPLLLFIHGGPHGSISSSFLISSIYFACAGIATLLVNYRGSIGYGQASLASLPGKCGKQDVADCVNALKHAIELRGKKEGDKDTRLLNGDELLVQGGSHGGFLTAHLIGQHPTLFLSAACRNPVVNVANMAATTDIPDWCYSECGLDYDPCRPPTVDVYKTMLEASPVFYAGAVKTPLLFLLGTGDKRVPMAQAVDYFRLVRSRGVVSRMLVYPEAQHSLMDKVSIETDVWVNMLRWLYRRFDADDLDLSLKW